MRGQREREGREEEKAEGRREGRVERQEGREKTTNLSYYSQQHTYLYMYISPLKSGLLRM